MRIIDPGHIYEIDCDDPLNPVQRLTFVKRSGGAITYDKVWPGLQTQMVMRALIWGLALQFTSGSLVTQLDTEERVHIWIYSAKHAIQVLEILGNRSCYLNNILPCKETQDAIFWISEAILELKRSPDKDKEDGYPIVIDYIRHALWSYEARALRRKRESINRKQPAHSDTERLRSWRNNPASDIPFNADEIEDRPIGKDGHIVIS